MEGIVSTETVYRFFVREKAEGVPPPLRRVFLTRGHLSEAQAAERYEVVERVEHTARSRELDDGGAVVGMH